MVQIINKTANIRENKVGTDAIIGKFIDSMFVKMSINRPEVGEWISFVCHL